MARILKRSQRKMESAIDVPSESEYKAFQDLRSHLIMLKNGLPYFEESIHPVMEVLKVKEKILDQHSKDAYRLGSTYQSRPFELVDTAPLKKAFEADQFKLHEMKKEISKEQVFTGGLAEIIKKHVDNDFNIKIIKMD